MKKSIIAASAASLAVAAMPVVGAFAATSTVTDTLNVNIPASCTIRNDETTGESSGTPSTENVYNVTMKNGELRDDIGTGASGVTGDNDNTIEVSCNIQSGTDAGWSLAAAGKGGSTALVEQTDSSKTIPTGDGTGTTSYWQFKTAATGVTYTTPYASGQFAAVPSSATIATGTGDAEFTMTYKVYVDLEQATGTYTGGVVYTLTNPQS